MVHDYERYYARAVELVHNIITQASGRIQIFLHRFNSVQNILIRGHILNHKQVKPYRTKKVSIYSAEGASICVDGRTLEYSCPLEISLMPEFLNFIVPD